MAITQVSPNNGDGITWFSNSNNAALEHNNLQAGDVVFILVHRRRTSGTATSTTPATIITGSSPQDINSSFRSIDNVLQSSPIVDWYINPNRNNARMAAGVFQFVVTANDLTSGRLALTFSFGSSLRQGLAIVAFRGVDTGTYFSTTTSGSNELLCTSTDSGPDNAIEFTAPNATADSNFWNSNTGNLDVPHTVLAMGAFGRTDFDANSGTTGWSPAFNLAGTNSFIDSGSNHTLLGMYQNFSTFGTANMDNVSVTTSNNNQRSFSFWIVLREAATATDHAEAFTDSASATDALSVIHGVAHTFSETDSASVADTLAVVETGTAHTFAETDSGSASDSLTTVETGTDHTFSQTDSATASDSLTVVETGTDHTFSQTDSATSADLLTRGHGRLFSETDSASVTDSLSVVETGTDHTFGETDSASASDSLTAIETGVANTFNETDSASAADSLTTLETGTSHTFGETDSASVVDALTAQEVGTQHTFGETDTSSVADTLTTQRDAVFTATDQSTVADTLVTADQGQSFFDETDSATVSDTLEAVRSTPHTFSESDSASASDSLSVTETGTAHTFSETDSASVADALLSPVQRILAFTDAASCADALETGKEQTLSFADSASASDELAVIKSAFFVVTDSTSASDLLTSVSGQNIEITDSATAGDELTAEGPVVKNAEITLFGLGGLDLTLLTKDQAMSVLNIWNTALTSLGVTTIKAVDEGSPQQVLLTNVFPLFKQQFLADHVWNGAKKTKKLSSLTDNAGAVVTPVSRWSYAYVLPTDAVRIWRLNGLENQPNYVGGFANNLWEIESVVSDEGTANEATTRCLCTDEGTATVEYVFDVPDANVGTLLSPLVKHAMGKALAVYVAQNFGKNSTEIAQLEALAKEAVLAAKGVDGQEGTPQIMSNTSLLGVRYL